MKNSNIPIGWLQVSSSHFVPLLVIIGWFACVPVSADDVSEKSNHSSDEISLHECDDDLDASFLRKRVHVRAERLPLVDFATQLSKQVEVPVLIDRAVADAGMRLDEPVTFSTEQPGLRQKVDELIAARTPIEDWDHKMTMRLDQVLDHTLRDISMTWYVEEGFLHLTTWEHARAHYLIDRSYSLTPF